jgi:Protein of unknown function (DUF1553)/Protein of unknown function (DUF1549)/Planctomycete cytochrome C/Concanavalin A-like lectin/glucanases superfamily
MEFFPMPHFMNPYITRLLLQTIVVFLIALECTSVLCEDDQQSLVGNWRFGTEEVSKLSPVGGVHRDQAGPRPPEFPDFDAGNTAVKLDGKGARLVFQDSGAGSDFDFNNGDSITIEAWVNVSESLGDDRNIYIIGKGRTGNKQFAANNQNWALRIRSIHGVGHVSFLFATPNGSANVSWHRWTSNEGFHPGTGWHRLAVSYEFGKPESISGWLDDKRQDGKWDMGGKTTEPPVVDDDDVWIGSALSGGASNSFHGLIDEISVFRKSLTHEQMSKRYRREGPDRNHQTQVASQTAPDFGLRPGAVVVRLFEGLPAHDRWSAPETYQSNLVYEFDSPNMLFPRLPRRYDAWGIRATWKAPVLLQAVTEVQLPPGQHQLLVRARGLSRVWLDEKIVAKFATRKGGTDGHNPVEPIPNPPAEDHRLVKFGDQEAIAELDIPAAGVYRLALETIVGSNKARAETGETLIAVRKQSESDFHLIQSFGNSDSPVSLREGSIADQLRHREELFTDFDHRNRRSASASQDAYWQRRREYAASWLKNNPPPARSVNSSQTNTEPTTVDQFLDQRIAHAKTEIANGNDPAIAHFHETVMPILRDHCWRCHADRAEGGLKLTSLEHTTKGGDSGKAAIVPSDPKSSELLRRVRSDDDDLRMPPSGALTAEQQTILAEWIGAGAKWGRVVKPESVKQPAVIDDAAFIRRAYLDTCGVPPTETDTREFLDDDRPDKRHRLVQNLLQDPRLADHWVSYWQDVLAENPNMLKPSLNNTGPFRYFLYESILDHKPMDRMVSELIMLRGSEREGGSAGFGMAADNDSPLASRSIVAASAFLGVNLQCARCHDSPYHSTTQQDLFATASMLARKPLTVPKTSTVAPGFFEKNKDRASLIKVTLQPGLPVEPQWCFGKQTGALDNDDISTLINAPDDSRERLAVLITAPQNKRFASVVVNRIWKRLMGAGIVEPVDDWENQSASHPELLDWLSRQLVESGYDLRHVMQLIMISQAYQRDARGKNLEAPADERYFASPDRRRLTAEQVVDSLFAASGHELRVEELTFDSDSRRPAETMISLGTPKRAWQFATLSNERDRPSLSFPRAQMVTDVMEVFGWTGSRQSGRTSRDDQPNVLQPGILAGGIVSTWITRATMDSELANLAVQAQSADKLVESLYLRFLSRYPSSGERNEFFSLLTPGFDSRLLAPDQVVRPTALPSLGTVGWTNHLRSEANEIMLEQERRARLGDPADPRLETSWRESYEDVVWTLINSPEFVWVP